MSKQKKARNHVEYDGKASSVRRNSVQLAAAKENEQHKYNDYKPTPWEKAKAKRLARRQAAGKTFANWSKNATYKESGPHSVKNATDDFRVDTTKRTRNDRRISGSRA